MTRVIDDFETSPQWDARARVSAKRDPKDSDRYSAMRSAGLAITIPAMMGATALVGCVSGYYLDRWLGTSPWLLLVCMILGFVAGIRETMQIVRKMGDNKDQ